MEIVSNISPKFKSTFSIESILKKEEECSRTPTPASHEDLQGDNYIESWREEEFKQRMNNETLSRLTASVLENRERQTEHWLCRNNFKRPNPLSLIPSPTRNISINHSTEHDLIPSPSSSSSWSSPTEQKTMEMWFLKRHLSSNDVHKISSHQMKTERRTSPYSYWNSSLLNDRDENKIFPTLSSTSESSYTRNSYPLTLNDEENDENNRKGGQVRFSHTQSTELERVFVMQKYISPQERKYLAKSLDLSERQVKTWFQNRRAKWRRIKLEDEMRMRMSENCCLTGLSGSQLTIVTDDKRIDCR